MSEPLSLTPGLAQKPVPEIVAALQATAESMIRDGNHTMDSMPGELSKDVAQHIQTNRLPPDQAALIRQAEGWAVFEARRNFQAGRLRKATAPSWFEKEQSSRAAWAEMRERQAQDDAARAASEASFQTNKIADAAAAQQRAVDAAVAAAIAAAQPGVTAEAVRAARRVAKRATEAAATFDSSPGRQAMSSTDRNPSPPTAPRPGPNDAAINEALRREQQATNQGMADARRAEAELAARQAAMHRPAPDI